MAVSFKALSFKYKCLRFLCNAQGREVGGDSGDKDTGHGQKLTGEGCWVHVRHSAMAAASVNT